MLSRIEKYRITTLRNLEHAKVKQIKDCFNNIVKQLMEEKPEFIDHVRIDYIGQRKSQVINVGRRSFRICRMEWHIKGEKDILDQFFDEWKRIDKNPCRDFRVEHLYSWPEFSEATIIKGKEEDEL